jgi:hypothetical protein
MRGHINIRHADTYVAYEDMTLASHTTSTTSCLLPYAFCTKLTYDVCLMPHTASSSDPTTSFYTKLTYALCYALSLMPYALSLLHRNVLRPYYFNHVMALQMVGANIEVLPYAVCLMPYALCLMPTLRLMPYALYLPYALCLTSTLCLMPYTKLPYALCLILLLFPTTSWRCKCWPRTCTAMPYALCLMPYALCLMAHASCLMPDALCLTSWRCKFWPLTCSYCYLCVLILQFMCPRTTICVLKLLYMCPHIFFF